MTEARDTVLFVSVTGGLGGPSRSLATVLAHLDSAPRRALASPEGGFLDLVRRRGLCDEHVAILDAERPRRISTLRAMARVARWCWRRRGELLAIHANGLAELNLVAPAAVLSRTPVVVWTHTSEPSGWTRRLAPLWRRALPHPRWAAVSRTSMDVVVELGLCRPGDVSIVPNPVDPADVEAVQAVTRVAPTVGYVGPATRQKGFDMLPELAERLAASASSSDDGTGQGSGPAWAIFVPASSAPSVPDAPAFRRLRAAARGAVELHPWVEDVREVYARCDVLLCPSYKESFGRVAAEAMVNGLPVVASDLPAYRELLGDGDAGLLFPLGDAEAAASRIQQLLADPSLGARLGERGRARARAFAPEQAINRLIPLWYASADGRIPSRVPAGVAGPPSASPRHPDRVEAP